MTMISSFVVGWSAVLWFVWSLGKKTKRLEQPQDIKVLSLQSSVVYGYVGNKASMFPLQIQGVEVDPINSCQFSNHTGYPTFTGSRTTGEELNCLVNGMMKNSFLGTYTDVLTGYMSSVSFLMAVADLVRRLRILNPTLRFLCDPVLGDNGKLYVAEEFVAIYREQMIPIATVVTPNQTEAELLTGIRIHTTEDARRVCQWFHDRGVETVVITSCELDRSLPTNRYTLRAPAVPGPQIDVLASCLCEVTMELELYHLSVPKVKQSFNGTGDLCSAMLLSWLTRNKYFPRGAALRIAIENTMATLQSVIHRTVAAGRQELMLVQSQADILRPQVVSRAVRLII